MAIRVSDVKLVTNPEMQNINVTPGAKVSYTLDSAADVAGLPITGILAGSDAFVPSTGQAFILDGNGWQQI